ncbi:mannitol dehydrogenase family protein [Promicromonospora thailandica]|uniref:Mannitol-1-phosphate 5-dehydrogenase n=1 Tax=Promicromonospora thailandica TaxID=765201 RepID=A0A9X2JVX2_9MICO|nr:mannitol dehydrogenase family protein [Promicromonospora thailandica]MCP2266025.1 mannitol 2-dehydrogenase [Promicromonospora thailandica]
MTLDLATTPADDAAPAGTVELPPYDRAGIRTGIVHLGVGGFHRAHQALAVDELLRRGEAREWGICGVGLMSGDAAMRDALRPQDGLYTLVTKHADGGLEARVVGSIVDYLFAPDDPEAVLERLAHPDTRIVSLTITEGGYNFDQVTGEFDVTAPAVVADARPGAVPTTVFGYVVEALARRRARGVPPFTVMSCDNVQGNGAKARAVFAAFAALRDPELGAWVHNAVAFPNSMVDRITPVTTDADRALVRDRFGVEDRWPVVAEPFFQWVLEDDFPQGRPPLEHAGVQLVADVEPYELMKLRLLNVSHQALAYLGWLSGYRYAHEAVADPLLARFVRDYMDEATPTLRPVPGVDLGEYKATLVERFGNPEVADTLARLCAETSDRIPKWLVPLVRERLRAGGGVTRSAAIVASWARYAEGTDEQGEPIAVVDRLADVLVARARSQRDGDPLAFLRDPALFGDLVDEPRFTGPYLDALGSLHRSGAQATLRTLTGA